MATYKELKTYADSISGSADAKKLSNEMKNIGLADTDHVPGVQYSDSWNLFSKHKDLPGMMTADFSMEPEDYRDCYNNNYSVLRINDVMPYLDKINSHLSESDLNDKNYSRRVLRLAAECVDAHEKDHLSDEKIDYMISKSIDADLHTFGHKRFDMMMPNVRSYLKNYSFDQAKMLSDIDPNARDGVRYFLSHLPFDEKAISVIGKSKSPDIGFGVADYMLTRMQSHMDDHTHFSENEYDELYDKADIIVESCNSIRDAGVTNMYDEDGPRALMVPMSSVASYEVPRILDEMCPVGTWKPSESSMLHDRMRELTDMYTHNRNGYDPLLTYVIKNPDVFDALKKGIDNGDHSHNQHTDATNSKATDVVVFDEIKESSVRHITPKDSSGFYSVAFAVPKSVSDNCMAFVTFSEDQVSKNDDDTYSVSTRASSTRKVAVMKDGKHDTCEMTMDRLFKAREVRLSKQASRVQSSDFVNTTSEMDHDGMSM